MSLETLFSTNIIVPIVVAFIGFLVAVTTAIIAKEHKVSEFRQAWINDLRNDLAISLKSAFDCIYELQNDSKNHDIQKYNESFRELEFRLTLIKLRLNPKKDASFITLTNSLLHQLFEVHKAPNKSKAIRECQNSAKMIEALSHEMLKNEWERVKLGEKGFLRFKSFGKFLASTFMIAI
ncbi:hypothetical protein ACS8FA_15185, partial [Psychrobacter sp. 1Y1]|uniref:hypothetical protein n=1 Tax=Psychrobacter sp. 1Y1 TaxID=3453574 RepID=UPI003F45AC68